MIVMLGGAGLGLVWGWLICSHRSGQPPALGVLVGGAVVQAVLAGWLSATGAALIVVLGAILGCWLHLSWLGQIRARRGRSRA
jgi:hypothetical protein